MVAASSIVFAAPHVDFKGVTASVVGTVWTASDMTIFRLANLP